MVFLRQFIGLSQAIYVFYEKDTSKEEVMINDFSALYLVYITSIQHQSSMENRTSWKIRPHKDL